MAMRNFAAGHGDISGDIFYIAGMTRIDETDIVITQRNLVPQFSLRVFIEAGRCISNTGTNRLQSLAVVTACRTGLRVDLSALGGLKLTIGGIECAI